LPTKIERARHVGYTAGGTPLVRRLPNLACAPPEPDQPLALRHVGYFGGIPLAAYAWECCDALCTDAEEEAGDCYKQTDCWPYGPGPGITKRVAAYFFDVADCWSARRQNCVPHFLEYDPGDGKWHGSIGLRGGTLDLTFECLDAGTLRLTWSGCGDAGGHVDVVPSCNDPLAAAFQISYPQSCCDCWQTADPDRALHGGTDTPPEVTVWVVANCRRVRFARHVGYTADRVPIVARENPCAWNQDDCYQCANMQCPLVAEISAVDGACACMEGVYFLTHGDGHWVGSPRLPIPPGMCIAGTLFQLNCTDLGTAVPPDLDPTWCRSCGYVRLSLAIVCGVDNVFTFGDVVIPACDLENLDVTFDGSGTFVTDDTCCAGRITVRVMR
jgi:hypothetical protein